jgi:hypothetical protein
VFAFEHSQGERESERERDSGPARPRRHQPAGPFPRPPANTPAACIRTPTQTRPEKHVQPRSRARRKRCASPRRVCTHSKRSKLDSCPLRCLQPQARCCCLSQCMLHALQRGRRRLNFVSVRTIKERSSSGRAGVPHLTAWTVRAARCSAATADSSRRPPRASDSWAGPTQLTVEVQKFAKIQRFAKVPGSKSRRDSELGHRHAFHENHHRRPGSGEQSPPPPHMCCHRSETLSASLASRFIEHEIGTRKRNTQQTCRFHDPLLSNFTPDSDAQWVLVPPRHTAGCTVLSNHSNIQ